MVEVLLDTSAPGLLVPVAVARHPSALPVAVDRNRTAHPHGPSWHTLLLRLVHSDDPNGPPLAEASRRIRFTGPRKISMEKTLTASGVEGEAGGRTGRRFPETSPDVCCAFLSSGRLHLLRRSLSALVRHLERFEPDILYELAWVDNDSGPGALDVYRDFDFERVALYRVNYGATHGFNTLLFDLCRRSRYVMTMEEDWEWIEERTHIKAIG